MMKRTTSVLATVGAAALLLAGCSGSSTPASDGPAEITFWHGYTEADGKVLDQIVADFNASQQQYKITTETKTWAVIDDTLLPALSSKEGPQIVAMPAERMPVYADRGAFADLTDFYGSADSNTADLVSQAVDMVTVGGTPYGVPTGFVPLAMFYNKALFTAAGITEPPATWDAWVADAKKLTVDENGDGTPEEYGVAIPDHATVANGLWPSLLLSGGGQIVDGGDKAVIDSSENAATIQYWTDAITKDKISPTGLDGIAADQLFSSGKAAMHVGGPWMASIAKENNIDYGIAALPAGPAEQAASAIGVAMGITESADDQQRAGAEAFFTYFFQKDVATQWSLGSGWPPLRTDIPLSAVESNPVVAALSEIAPTGRALLPGVVNSVDVITDIDELTQKAVAGGDVDELLSTAQDKIQQAIN
ncbi:multiple sugar transport system substrate-binding protein [Microbacterium sp. ru370.1]|uniref:ABC transporter substrate-binding protein n=1 Tax=unclassified Microbacterium TaxID=2609290 RepID=UPI00088930D7|nr:MULTISPECIES: ABC transporter substrate-binding protein [unclassified Microbacterium]SDO27693.1 multiple sugar transport system substrate-binding protein [Microbacterium sp. ru370.1]SIT74873.1 multiple sugar transport system substrate-binding protein [Microbacterium sp. RU1D]